MPGKQKPREGEMNFRLLCPTHAAGGLIGHSGEIINRLVRETSCIIHVDSAASRSAKDRVVHITGSTSINRTLSLDHRVFPASSAQLGLFRVFERVLDSGASGGGMVWCVLLVGSTHLTGKFADKVVQQTGAYVKVSSSNLPRCARPTDHLIRISGDSSAVKKAVIVVSRYLQKKLVEGDKSVRRKERNARMENAVSGAEDVLQVVFKLLCPNDVVGEIIGCGGKVVKALERETGASICFFPRGTGCRERVVVVSASEDRKSQNSCCQNAVVRVFREIFSLEQTDTVTARLLILPHQSDWLRMGENSILSAIQKATGAILQVVELDCSPLGASPDEIVLQIDGDRQNVQFALLHVSWKLREILFGTLLEENNTPVLPHELFNRPSKCNEIALLTDNMNSCRVSKEFSSKQCLTTSLGSSVTSRDVAPVFGGSGFGSGSKSAVVTNTQLEIVVREDVFGAVYGDKGSNLARLRQISGATVEVHDPCPGREGKVIISGTHDQTMVAESLLQAFLLSDE